MLCCEIPSVAREPYRHEELWGNDSTRECMDFERL